MAAIVIGLFIKESDGAGAPSVNLWDRHQRTGLVDRGDRRRRLVAAAGAAHGAQHPRQARLDDRRRRRRLSRVLVGAVRAAEHQPQRLVPRHPRRRRGGDGRVDERGQPVSRQLYGVVTSRHGRRSPALWVAIAATALSLGLPLVGDLPGRVLTVRVLLVAAIVLLIIAMAGSTTGQTRDHLVVAAVGLLVFTAALVSRGSAPTGVVLLAIAIGSLVWQRRAWAPRAVDASQRAAAEPISARGSAAAQNVPFVSMTMALAWPVAPSNGRAVATAWPRSRSRSSHAGGAPSSTTTVGAAGRRPGVEAGLRSAQHPPRRGERRRQRLSGVEQTGDELRDDLRLGVTAHRSEHGGDARHRGERGRGRACAAAGDPACQLGGMTRRQGEPDAAVLQVDRRSSARPGTTRTRLRSTGSG